MTLNNNAEISLRSTDACSHIPMASILQREIIKMRFVAIFSRS